MSYSYQPPPGNGAGGFTPLQTPTLADMLEKVALAVIGGLLGAVYTAANEEFRLLLNSIRLRRRLRQARHEFILMETLGTDLDALAQDFLLQARDAFRAALTLLADPALSREERQIIRNALSNAINARID